MNKIIFKTRNSAKQTLNNLCSKNFVACRCDKLPKNYFVKNNERGETEPLLQAEN